MNIQRDKAFLSLTERLQACRHAMSAKSGFRLNYDCPECVAFNDKRREELLSKINRPGTTFEEICGLNANGQDEAPTLRLVPTCKPDDAEEYKGERDDRYLDFWTA